MKKLDVVSFAHHSLFGRLFSRNDEHSSQVGYTLFLTGKYDNANLMDFASITSKRVIRSLLGAKTFLLADLCDTAVIIQHYLKRILVIILKITISTYISALLNVFIRTATTTENINGRHSGCNRSI